MNKRTPLLLVAGLLLPVVACAHPGHAGDGFSEGFMHPFLGLDHLLAMVVVGIWSVLHSRRVWLAPLVFVSFLALGAVLGHGGLVVPQLEPLVAASVLVLGLMLATPLGRDRAVPPVAPLTVIGAFALCHGMAHGGELGAAGSVLAGIVLGSALLHGAGMLLAQHVLQQRESWTRRLGQAVALVGGVLLVNTLF